MQPGFFAYGFTFSDSTADVLSLKFESPLYTAVIECVPSASDAEANVAFLLLLSVPVPSSVTPSINVTVPVGVPTPGATTATVAVNVTVAPEVDGFGDAARVTLVFALSTTWDNALDVLVR